MKIRCLGYARIIDPQGRYLLWIDNKQEGEERRVLRPIGGVLQLYTESNKREVIETFGARNFTNGLDLQFHVPDGAEVEIDSWMRSLRGYRMRETSIARQMIERVVKQSELLTFQDFKNASEKFGHFCYQEPAKNHHDIVDVYDWELTDKTLAKLLRIAEVPDSKIYFAYEDEIRRCSTTSNREISKAARALPR